MKRLLFITAFILFVIISAKLNAQILSVAPDTVEQGQKLDIDITAENIDFTQGTNLIRLIQGNTELYMSEQVVNSPTSLTINYAFNSDIPVGFYNLSISSTSSVTKENAIFIKPDRSKASLDSINQETGKQGQVISILFYGTNTNFNKHEAANSVYLTKEYKKISAISINSIDSSTLEATFSFSYAHSIGTYSVNVYNAYDGTITIPNGFKLFEGSNTPSIISVVPDTVEQGQKLDIDITAENIDFTQGTNLIRLIQGNTELYMSEQVVNSPTSITINYAFNSDIPVGFYNLSISSTSSVTKENAIFIKPDRSKASLDSINQETGKQGQVISILLYGTNTNFNKFEAANSVYLTKEYKKISAISINPIDSSTLEATFSFSYAHSIGTYSVNVYNAYDGTITIPDGFKLFEGNSTPSILIVDPDTVVMGEELEIGVTAENIDFTQGTNVICFNQESTELYMSHETVINPNSLNIYYTFSEFNPLGYYDLKIHNTESGITMTKQNAIYLRNSIPDALIDISKYGILYYPNPVKNYLYFKNKYQTVEIYDMNGHLVLKSQHSDFLDVSELQQGMYAIKLKIGKELIVNKLIIE